MTIAISSTYTQRYHTWTVWKTIKIAKNLVYQHEDDGIIYTIYGYDGPEVHICNIYKGEVPYTSTYVYSQAQNDIDRVDFENNFLANSNKTINFTNDNGNLITAPTFENIQGMTTIWKGRLYTAQPNSLNIYDELITTQLKLREGWYRLLTSNATIGDYLEFSIIDKDDVLGYFSYFGLTPGIDVLELKKFIRTEYVSPLSFERQCFLSSGASEVMTGLYFRTYYFNSGSTEVKFTTTEKYHEN